MLTKVLKCVEILTHTHTHTHTSISRNNLDLVDAPYNNIYEFKEVSLYRL